MKENNPADRLAGKATLTQGLRLERSGVLWSLRHYLRAQNQGHYTINRLRSMIFLERTRGPSSVRRTLELFQWQRWGKRLSDEVERM